MLPDGSSDLILAEEEVVKGAPTGVFKGRLVSTQAKAVVIMRDEQDKSDQETIVFKSAKSLKCTKFRVEILKSGKATCLNHHPKVTDENARSLKTRPRKLNKEKSKTAKFQGLGNVFDNGTLNNLQDVNPKEGEVCIPIKLKTMYNACEISWKFGTCVGSHYSESFTSYNHKCCQKPGNYTLECNYLGRDGWEGGYIQIGGSPTKYCRDWDGNVLDTKVHSTKNTTTPKCVLQLS